MKLVKAKIKGSPKVVDTKYGDRKAVVDCVLSDGQEIAIWGKEHDSTILTRTPGEAVTLAMNDRGKYSILEPEAQAEQNSQQQPDRAAIVPNAFDENGEMKIEVKKASATYVKEMTNLYQFCLVTVEKMIEGIDPEDKQAIADSIYQSVRQRFNL